MNNKWVGLGTEPLKRHGERQKYIYAMILRSPRNFANSKALAYKFSSHVIYFFPLPCPFRGSIVRGS